MSSLKGIFGRSKNAKSKKADTSGISPSINRLREKYRLFQEVLSANNAILKMMAEMEERLWEYYVFDISYVRSNCRIMAEKTHKLVENLDRLSNGGYPGLYDAFRKINSGIEELLAKKTVIPVSDFVIPFEHVTKDMVVSVGGKNVNLGEIKNRLNLPVPQGFCITAYAFKKFMDHNRLRDELFQRLSSVDIRDIEGLDRISNEVQDLIMNAQIPPELEKSILDAYLELSMKVAHRVNCLNVSVRSSAIHEDAQSSFAGQYATALNVTPENLLIKYKQIVASLFTPRAVFYYKSQGFVEEDMVMAVGVVEMIDAKASGVMYSRDPTGTGKDAVIITAVCGLGRYAVEGRVTPDRYGVSKDADRTILEKSISVKDVMLKCRRKGGVKEVEVPEEMRRKPCLTDDQIKALAGYAVVLERYYGKPQDIEWAVDQANNLYVLQTRPLRVLMDEPRRPVYNPYRAIRSWLIAARLHAKALVVVRYIWSLRRMTCAGFQKGLCW